MEIYSTMSREKEELNTLFEDKIKLFVCGPTVYDDAHIGHGRTYISFDTIKRYLEFKGYSVFYLQNITDIDDKIINRAKESGVDSKLLAKKFEKRFIEDMAALNVKSVNYFARATDHMEEILDQIQRLIDKGFAYVTETGVYFEVAKFKDYGKLANRKIEELETHRIDIDSSKKSPNDFALWKNREAEEFAGEPVWDSPWGKGRPGWHIEDTAITEKYFGPQYDIHGGGLDLIFPHHDSEIAQMEA
ncbi:MAG: class I tRNA ligase family protein, partial [Methanobrevibacter sp.]|nr:class I tRNA ligase family protein [Methanobrevibacter sp.]